MSLDGGRAPIQLVARASWVSVGRASAVVAAACFEAQSVLFLLDGTGLLARNVAYTVTGRGLQHDLADFYVAVNERMHTIWWDVAIRDTLGPTGYLAFMVVVLAVRRLAGDGHPRTELAVLFTVVGGAAAAASDLLYLSHVASWRGGEFQPTPDIVAYGRAAELLDTAGEYLQWAGFVVLAAGVVCLAATFRAVRPGRVVLPVMAYALAAALLASVVTRLVDSGIGQLVSAVAAGVLLAPAVALTIGATVVRLGPAATTPGEAL
jgi:hypothetical protein